MKRLRRNSLVFIGLIVLALLVAACGGGSPGGSRPLPAPGNGGGDNGSGDNGNRDAGSPGECPTGVDCVIITTLQQLQAIGNDQQSLSKYYILGNDINAADTKTWNNNQGFQPIGTSDEPFTGTFDGQNKTISNLHINRPEGERVGLFGQTDFGTSVRNVTLKDVHIVGNMYVGALGGDNSGTVENVHVVNGKVTGGTWVGGLVGENGGLATIKHSSSTDVKAEGINIVGGLVGRNFGKVSDSHSGGTVRGLGTVGGLVGLNNDGEIADSWSSAKVDALSDYAGGLVGNSSGGIASISNSYASGNVSGAGDFVGGLTGTANGVIVNSAYVGGEVKGRNQVGGLVGESIGTIERSFSTGQVTGSGDKVGGLLGEMKLGSIKNSYSRADVNGQDGVGGLIGAITSYPGLPNEVPFIKNTYSAGSVSATNTAGGLIGKLILDFEGKIDYTLKDSYWDTEKSDQTGSAGADEEGKPTADMKKRSTYSAWNFDDIWQIDPSRNDGYPDLRSRPDN